MRFLGSVIANVIIASYLLTLDGCAGYGVTVSTDQPKRNQSEPALATQPTDHLFVANFGDDDPYISMYGLHSNKLQRRISAPIYTQYSIADDASGRLYVMDRNLNRVVVYGPKKRFVSYIISQDLEEPLAIALDSSGALYIANYYKGNVEVFAPGSKTLQRTISDGAASPVALAFDRSGNLLVVNSESSTHSVSVYPPGGGHPKKTITHGIQNPSAVAADADGNLYVINHLQGFAGNVKVYAAGTYSLSRTITSGMSFPDSLAFDHSGNLYVGNATNITVYAPGSSQVLRSLSVQANGSATRSLIFDGNGELYAAYQGVDFGGVQIYDPGSNSPSLSIGRKQGAWQPIALAIGP